jgi:glycosyltransferase involved in cell wall biosynthesis
MEQGCNMNRPIISLAIIAKDEDELLNQCLESVRSFVDEIIVVETDVPLSSARRLADRIVPFKWINDFSAAREFSFAQTTGDWILWLDADDVVKGADSLQTIVAEAPPETQAIFLKYIYARDEYGNSTCELYRERLIKQGAPWRWRGRVHECLIPESPSHARRDERMVVIHQRDSRDGRSSVLRNIALLEEELQAEPNSHNPWAFQYLAREYASLGDNQRALNYCHRYLANPHQQDTQYQIQHHLADLLRRLGRYHDS